MKKYTASDIVERAFKLSDLTNTDFITYDEKVDYLNDSWTEVYNVLIAHGDKQFVREVNLGVPFTHTNGYTAYTLPFDLYKILSIRDPASGINLERHTESTPNNSSTYEVVNNELRVYGGVLAGNLVLTYYVVPLFLSIPNRDVEVNSLEEILSTVNNAVLYASGEIVNLLTNERIGDIVIVEGREYILGNGHVIELTLNEEASYYEMKYLDYDGQLLYEEQIDDPYFYTDEEGNVYWNNDGVLNIFGQDSKIEVTPQTNGILFNDGRIIAGDDMTIVSRFDGNDSYIKDNKLYSIVDDNYTREESIDYPLPRVDGVVKYGLIIHYGSYRLLRSYIPDTLLNFPNELYFQLIAANMAVRLLMKQNADSQGMNSIYENMLATFKNSLGQEGSYLVVRNAY